MAILGHESIASAQVYTKAYDRARAADMGAELLAEANPPTSAAWNKRSPKGEPAGENISRGLARRIRRKPLEQGGGRSSSSTTTATPTAMRY